MRSVPSFLSQPPKANSQKRLLSFSLAPLPLLFALLSFALLLLSSPIVVYAQPDSTQEVYEYVMQWGSLGSGDGQFDLPAGSCFDPSGYLYVCDRSNNRIQKFDRNGNFILKWGSFGRDRGQFDEPMWITSDRSGHVYVNDAFNDRIQVFDSQGNFIRMWADSVDGISFAPSGKLYVARPPDSLAVVDTLGNYIRSWGNGDPWWWPAGVAVDDSEHIYVSQLGNVDSNYIQKFDSLGTPLLKWGGWGSGNGQFAYVFQLAIGDTFKVFATDCSGPAASAHRMQKFNSGGRFITTWGTLGTGNGEFDLPYGVAVDTEGYVYVSDASLYSTNNRIQKFRKTVVGVEVSPSHESRVTSYRVSPNPFTSFATVSGHSSDRFALFDISGRKVGVYKGDRIGEGLSAGVYFLRALNGSSKPLRIVKLR